MTERVPASKGWVKSTTCLLDPEVPGVLPPSCEPVVTPERTRLTKTLSSAAGWVTAGKAAFPSMALSSQRWLSPMSAYRPRREKSVKGTSHSPGKKRPRAPGNCCRNHEDSSLPQLPSRGRVAATTPEDPHISFSWKMAGSRAEPS